VRNDPRKYYFTLIFVVIVYDMLVLVESNGSHAASSCFLVGSVFSWLTFNGSHDSLQTHLGLTLPGANSHLRLLTKGSSFLEELKNYNC
jgi:hypothetical protein